MGLSERFELIHAQQRVKGAVRGRSDKRTREKRKDALEGIIAKQSGRPHFGRVGGRRQGDQIQPRKVQFQAELVARVAAASGQGGWEAAWNSAHAGAWQAGAESWGHAGWQTPTARKLDLSTGSILRGKGRGGKGYGGKGRGAGRGAGRGGRGHQGLAIKWQRPPSTEEQAVLDAASSMRREAMNDDLDEYWNQQVPA